MNHTLMRDCKALAHSKAAAVFPVLVLGCGIYWPAITNPLAAIDLLLSIATLETWRICISSSSGSSWQGKFHTVAGSVCSQNEVQNTLWPGSGRESSAGLGIIMANPSIWHSKWTQHQWTPVFRQCLANYRLHHCHFRFIVIKPSYLVLYLP